MDNHNVNENIFNSQEIEDIELEKQHAEERPERFVTLHVPINQADEVELEKEAEWIFCQAFTQKPTISNQECKPAKSPLVVKKIRDTLNFIRNEYFEIPFIASYRKEYISPDLDLEDLWKIDELNQKFCQLKMRKDHLVQLFQRMQKFQLEQMKLATARDENKNPENLNEDDDQARFHLIEMIRPLDEKDIDRVKNAQTVEEVLDCHHHFHLHYGSDLIPMKEFEAKMEKLNKTSERKSQEAQNVKDGNYIESNKEEMYVVKNNDYLDENLFKFTLFASKNDAFHNFKLVGLNSLAKQFGLSPEKFAENLQVGYQKHEIYQCSVEPSVMATAILNRMSFNSVEQILTSIRFMVSIQLARDPMVRQLVRSLYIQSACINVKPTLPKGN